MPVVLANVPESPSESKPTSGTLVVLSRKPALANQKHCIHGHPWQIKSPCEQTSLHQPLTYPVQGFRVTQGIPVIGFVRAVDQSGDCQLDLLATAGVGNVGHFHDVFGYVPGAGAFADSGFQGFDQVVGDSLAGDVDDGGPYLVGMLPRFIDRL